MQEEVRTALVDEWRWHSLSCEDRRRGSSRCFEQSSAMSPFVGECKVKLVPCSRVSVRVLQDQCSDRQGQDFAVNAALVLFAGRSDARFRDWAAKH